MMCVISSDGGGRGSKQRTGRHGPAGLAGGKDGSHSPLEAAAPEAYSVGHVSVDRPHFPYSATEKAMTRHVRLAHSMAK